MKYIYLIAIVNIFCFACQKQEIIDTGSALAKHDCSMLEYMKTDSYNWDTTILMIERAGLEDLFEGNDSEYPQITFLGCTNHSIRRWMFSMGYLKVSDIPQEQCNDIILRHVIAGKYMVKDVPAGVDIPRSGGQFYETLAGSTLWLYTYKDPWGGIANAGPNHLYIESDEHGSKLNIASSDIQCETGVVHSIHYDYTIGEL